MPWKLKKRKVSKPKKITPKMTSGKCKMKLHKNKQWNVNPGKNVWKANTTPMKVNKTPISTGPGWELPKNMWEIK